MPSTEATEPMEWAASLTEVGALLIKHFGLKEGRYQVGIGFRLGVGGIPGKNAGDTIPGGMVGVESINLIQVEDDFTGPNVLDAASVNKPKTGRRKKSSD